MTAAIVANQLSDTSAARFFRTLVFFVLAIDVGVTRVVVILLAPEGEASKLEAVPSSRHRRTKREEVAVVQYDPYVRALSSRMGERLPEVMDFD